MYTVTLLSLQSRYSTSQSPPKTPPWWYRVNPPHHGQSLAILCNNRCIFYLYTFAFSRASHISHLQNVAFWVEFLSSIMMQLATRPVRLGQSEKESGRIWNWRGSGATSHRNLGGHNKSFGFTTGVMRSQWKFLSSWAIWSEYLKNNFGQPV